MKKQVHFFGLAVALTLAWLLAGAGTAMAKTDFSGRWVMDKSKSTGLPDGMQQNMTVEQKGDVIAIETDLFQNDQVNTVPDQYVLNGKEVEFPLQLPTGEKTMAKRVAKWNEKGDGFEVKDVAVFTMANGEFKTTTTRTWAMQADGKSLVIELTRVATNGTTSSKRTFNRK